IIIGSTIAGNIAENEAGGIYHNGLKNLELYNDIVYANYHGTGTHPEDYTSDDIIVTQDASHLKMAYTLYGNIQAENGEFTHDKIVQLETTADEIAKIFVDTDSSQGAWVPTLSEDGLTLAITTTGLAAHKGTLIGTLDDKIYYYDLPTGKWLNFTDDTKYNFDKTQSPHYGLENGTVIQVAQNWYKDEQGNYIEPVSRIPNLDGAIYTFQAGSFALKNAQKLQGIIVTTLEDCVNVWDGVTSLREAIITASEYANDEEPPCITFANGLFTNTDNIVIELTDNLYGEHELIIGTETTGHNLIIDATYDIQNNQYFENRTVTVIAEEGYHIFVADQDGADWDLTFKNLILEGGEVNGDGGALYVDGNEVNITLENTTVHGFHSTAHEEQTGQGGGIYARAVNDANITLNNVTLSDNQADAEGGALYLESIEGSTTVNIINSTVHGNTSYVESAPVYTTSSVNNDILVMNSIVYGNYSVTEDQETGKIVKQETNITQIADTSTNTLEFIHSLYGNLDTETTDTYRSHQFTDQNKLEANLKDIFTTVEQNQDGNWTAIMDEQSTLEITRTGKAAYLGTFIATLPNETTNVNEYYYLDQINREWVNTKDDTIRYDFDRLNSTHYGLTYTDGEGNEIIGNVYKIAQNMALNEETGKYEPVRRNYTTQSFNIGAYALQLLKNINDLSLVVDTDNDIINSFDDATSLREALSNAATIEAFDETGRDDYTITFDDTIFTDDQVTIIVDEISGPIQIDPILSDNQVTIDGGQNSDGENRTVVLKVETTTNEADDDNPASDYRLIEGVDEYAIWDLTLKNMVLQGGDISQNQDDADGAILNLVGANTTLKLDNVSMNQGVAANGGAINIHTLGRNEFTGNTYITIINSTLSHNTATENGGFLNVITQSEVPQNGNTIINILNSTVTANQTTDPTTQSQGGAIYSYSDNTNTVTMLNTIMAGSYTHNKANDIHLTGQDNTTNTVYAAYSIYTQPTTDTHIINGKHNNHNQVLNPSSIPGIVPNIFTKTHIDPITGNTIATLAPNNTVPVRVDGIAGASGTLLAIQDGTQTPYYATAIFNPYIGKVTLTWHNIYTGEALPDNHPSLKVVYRDQIGADRNINPKAGFTVGALNALSLPDPEFDPFIPDEFWSHLYFRWRDDLLNINPLRIGIPGLSNTRKQWQLGTFLFPDTFSYSVLGESRMTNYFTLASGKDLYPVKKEARNISHTHNEIPEENIHTITDTSSTPEEIQKIAPVEVIDSVIVSQATETNHENTTKNIYTAVLATNNTKTLNRHTLNPTKITNPTILGHINTQHNICTLNDTILNDTTPLPESEIVRILAIPNKAPKFQTPTEQALHSLLA
ncbi:MAG TPA: hypothetical protein PLR86_04935, partial [Planctomycetota bacterium]|nr:hypothetical protein [Planctomycetota bacterium]